VVADGEKEAAAQLICEKLPEPRRAAIGVVIWRRRRRHRQRASRVVHTAREDRRESRQRQQLPSGVQMASVAVDVGVHRDLAVAAASTTAPPP